MKGFRPRENDSCMQHAHTDTKIVVYKSADTPNYNYTHASVNGPKTPFLLQFWA